MSWTRPQAEGLTLLRSEACSSGFKGVSRSKPGRWAKAAAKVRAPSFSACYKGRYLGMGASARQSRAQCRAGELKFFFSSAASE